VQRNDLLAARRCFHRQLPFLRFIVKHGLPRAIAGALALMGTDVGPLRAPLRPLHNHHIAQLRGILEVLEVLAPVEERSRT
jgi:4-hydroxy-tetrahydrodipicolinate synthase